MDRTTTEHKKARVWPSRPRFGFDVLPGLSEEPSPRPPGNVLPEMFLWAIVPATPLRPAGVTWRGVRDS
jgi:hypothetical protein